MVYRFSLKVTEKGLCWFLKRVNPSINTHIFHVFPKSCRVKKIKIKKNCRWNHPYQLQIFILSKYSCSIWWKFLYFFTYITMSVFFFQYHEALLTSTDNDCSPNYNLKPSNLIKRFSKRQNPCLESRQYLLWLRGLQKGGYRQYILI